MTSPSSLTKSENGSLTWDLQIVIGGQRFTLEIVAPVSPKSYFFFNQFTY
jgi:hypothetical protein